MKHMARTNSQPMEQDHNFSQFLIKKLIEKNKLNGLHEDSEDMVPEEAWAKRKVLEHSKQAKDQGQELTDEQLYNLVVKDLKDS